MTIIDRRLPPFCWQSLDALEMIHDGIPEKSVAPCVALYVGLTYLASKKLNSTHEGFTATRAEVCRASGLSAGSVHKYTGELQRIGLLHKEERSVEGRSLAPAWTLTDAKRVSPADTRLSDSSENLTPTRAGDTATTRSKKSFPDGKEPLAFAEWLEFHCELTGQRLPGVGTKARGTLARKFSVLLGEGRSLDEFKLASTGAHSDEWLRENGKCRPENVLVYERIDGLIEKGQKAKTKPEAPSMVRTKETQPWEEEL